MSWTGLRARTAAMLAGRGEFILILLTVFCLLTGMGMVFSMLAIYGQTLGAGAGLSGLLLGVFGGARLLAGFPAGLASERLGRRAVMLAGLGLVAAGSAGAALTSTVPVLVACLLAVGAGSSSFVTAALAAVADLGTAESRMRDMAAFQGAHLLGISLGPALGGLTVSWGGFAAPFVVQGAMALIAAILLMRGQPSGAAPAQPAGPRPRLRDRLPYGAGIIAIVSFGTFFARVAANWMLVPLIARDAGMSMAAIGLVLTAGALANVAVLPLADPAARRLGRRGVVIAANVATLATLIVLAISHSPEVIWLTGAVLGATSAFAAPALSAIAADAARPGQVGAAMGMVRTMTDVGIVVGPIVASLAVEQLALGYVGGLAVTALVLAASTAIFAVARMPAAPVAPPERS